MTLLRFAQVKQVVPSAHGCPHALTNVGHLPCRQVTPGWSSKRSREPSSVL
jgi:hypothetical protein